MGDQGLSGLISGAVRVRAADRVRARARDGIRAGVAVRRAGTARVRITVLRIGLRMGIRIGYGFRSRLRPETRRGIEGEISAGIGRGIGRHGHFYGRRRLGRPGECC